ncbi:MAG: DUF885 domain-containing protein [Planctomycetota bacterium]|nr:DUF885 domain-containing protein [Planctomycetota bacterium]
MKYLLLITCVVFLGCQSTSKLHKANGARLNAFLEDVFEESLRSSPEWMTRMGMDDRNGEWDDRSERAKLEDQKRLQKALDRMRHEFRVGHLSDEDALSYRLFEYNAERKLEGYRWRMYNYPVNQMFGRHKGAPSLLINAHRVKNLQQAEAYVKRLEGMGPLLKQLAADVVRREEMGILPPGFVFPMVIQDCRNVIAGRPFTEIGEASILLADFTKKLAGLDGLEPSRSQALLTRAESALLSSVGPGYENLIEVLQAQQLRATEESGIWKWPAGDEYYAYALERTTTTQMTPHEIFELGQDEVARIHGEMRAIQEKVGYPGPLEAFFEHLRTDPRFYYPNTDEGRQAYLDEATAMVDNMRNRIPEVFNTLPKAEMEVKAVEAYRAKSAGKAFYSAGAPDGSRPGTYYANLYNMADMPTYQMEALAFHEGIPGHHMQISIAQELEGVPRFRKFGGYTAYSEGWGLYTEFLPKEMGFYQDPYSDFGRLAMELWRACRLVVDTGIHTKRWTREQAIDFLVANTPNPEGDCRKAIERYIVMPSQATAYKIGMIKILELREYAKSRLKKKFDLGEFHDVILRSGPVPLDILEERVRAYVRRTR